MNNPQILLSWKSLPPLSDTDSLLLTHPPQWDFFKDTWLKKTYFCDKQVSIFFKKG